MCTANIHFQILKFWSKKHLIIDFHCSNTYCCLLLNIHNGLASPISPIFLSLILLFTFHIFKIKHFPKFNKSQNQSWHLLVPKSSKSIPKWTPFQSKINLHHHIFPIKTWISNWPHEISNFQSHNLNLQFQKLHQPFTPIPLFHHTNIVSQIYTTTNPLYFASIFNTKFKLQIQY